MNDQPTMHQRLAVRHPPESRCMMHQCWSELLFLHWRVDPSEIQALLPAGLIVDCFQGHAYIGLVPFRMRRIRLRGTPSLPWISNFLEVNVRTYVHDLDGNPGVWFLSLDCNQPLAVWGARALFHLPYQHARMRVEEKEGGRLDYRSQRWGVVQGSSHFEYTIHSDSTTAIPGTQEFFLAERYLLFAADRRGEIYRGQVHHTPYPLSQVDVHDWSTDLFSLNGLTIFDRPFDHAIASRGVDVDVYGLVRVRPNISK